MASMGRYNIIIMVSWSINYLSQFTSSINTFFGFEFVLQLLNAENLFTSACVLYALYALYIYYTYYYYHSTICLYKILQLYYYYYLLCITNIIYSRYIGEYRGWEFCCPTTRVYTDKRERNIRTQMRKLNKICTRIAIYINRVIILAINTC